MSDGAESYRRRIYADYVGSIDPSLRSEVTRESLRSSDELYERYFLPHLPSDRKARILDVGCGRGAFLDFLGRRGYENGVGVDRSAEVVRRAQELGVRGIERGDLSEHLAARRGAYDCVVAVDVLEHLRKDEVLALLDAVFAALKPGGRVVIETVNADSPFFGRWLYVDFTHETAFTRYSLYQALSAAGFRGCRFFAMEPLGRGLRAAARRLLWRLMRLAMSLYYHVESGFGILRNDHILSGNLIAVGEKPAEAR